jgi:hypothetical protein
MYNVLVLTEMCVQDNLHLDLFRSEATGLEGMFLIDELDGDDGFGRVVRNGFADTRDLLLANDWGHSNRETQTYEAYAPCPIVLLTSRKGRFVGRGAIWLLGGAGPIVSRIEDERGRKSWEQRYRFCNARIGLGGSWWYRLLVVA